MLVFLQKSVSPPLNNFPGLTTIKTLGYLVSRRRQATQKRTFGQKCTAFWGKWLYSFFLPNKENILSRIALRY